MEINTNICEAHKTTKLPEHHVTIPVTLTVNGKATAPARITLIASVNVNVIEIDLATNVNVTGKAHEVVLTIVNAKAILKGNDIVSVRVRDPVIVVESVTKIVSVTETVKDPATKRGMVIEIKEETLTRLAIREEIHLIINTSKKTVKFSTLLYVEEVKVITATSQLESNQAKIKIQSSYTLHPL